VQQPGTAARRRLQRVVTPLAAAISTAERRCSCPPGQQDSTIRGQHLASQVLLLLLLWEHYHTASRKAATATAADCWAEIIQQQARPAGQERYPRSQSSAVSTVVTTMQQSAPHTRSARRSGSVHGTLERTHATAHAERTHATARADQQCGIEMRYKTQPSETATSNIRRCCADGSPTIRTAHQMNSSAGESLEAACSTLGPLPGPPHSTPTRYRSNS
jgi:hypothetical protein